MINSLTPKIVGLNFIFQQKSDKKLRYENGILFDYFVRKTMTQTIPLLKSSFPLLLKLEISLERPFIPERSEGIKES